MSTLVKFLVNEKHIDKDLFAYFPQLDEGNGCKQSYSLKEQHCPCSTAYAQESREATPAEYSDLQKELEQRGYSLKILNK